MSKETFSNAEALTEFMMNMNKVDSVYGGSVLHIGHGELNTTLSAGFCIVETGDAKHFLIELFQSNKLLIATLYDDRQEAERTLGQLASLYHEYGDDTGEAAMKLLN